MRKRTIYGTEFDLKRLGDLLNGARSWNKKDKGYLTKLEEELEWAQIMAPQWNNHLLSEGAVLGDADEKERR